MLNLQLVRCNDLCVLGCQFAKVALSATVTFNDSSVVQVGLEAHSILVHSTVRLSVQVQDVHGFGCQESHT